MATKVIGPVEYNQPVDWPGGCAACFDLLSGSSHTDSISWSGTATSICEPLLLINVMF